MSRQRIWVFGNILLCVVAANGWCNDINGNSSTVAPYSTPPGIVLIDVVREIAGSRPIGLWTQIGGAGGETLYVFDRDDNSASTCATDCARDFVPVIAGPNAVAPMHWSLIPIDGGKQQWAYRGKPLYRFTLETRQDEVIKNLIEEQFKDDTTDLISAQTKDTKSKQEQKQKLLPPAGWQVARFDLALENELPTAVNVRTIAAASLSGLVDANGMTLYAFAGGEEALESCGLVCLEKRVPLAAAELANALGDFSPIRRKDGTRQWAWRGAPLYTYSDDQLAGDISGVKTAGVNDVENEIDPRWYIPEIARHFMPRAVTLGKDLVRDLIFRLDGHPLYSRYIHQFVSTPGSELYQLYYRGKELGIKGCDKACEKTWHPYVASDSEQSQSYWEIYERENGIRQWAYKGFPLYTNSKDEAFGQATQSHIFDYIGAGENRYDPTEIIVDYDKAMVDSFFPALVWRVSKP